MKRRVVVQGGLVLLVVAGFVMIGGSLLLAPDDPRAGWSPNAGAPDPASGAPVARLDAVPAKADDRPAAIGAVPDPHSTKTKDDRPRRREHTRKTRPRILCTTGMALRKPGQSWRGRMMLHTAAGTKCAAWYTPYPQRPFPYLRAWKSPSKSSSRVTDSSPK